MQLEHILARKICHCYIKYEQRKGLTKVNNFTLKNVQPTREWAKEASVTCWRASVEKIHQTYAKCWNSKIFSPGIRKRSKMSILTTPIQHFSKCSRKCSRASKRKKGITIEKGEAKLLWFTDDVIAYIETPKDSTKKSSTTKKRIEPIHRI